MAFTYCMADGGLCVVEPLTPAILQRVQREADDALYLGNGASASCDDPEAVATSCFLCECCNSGQKGAGGASGHMAALARRDVVYVALAGSRFLGCVAGSWKQGRLLMHDLCVAPAARRQGVGQALVGTLRRRVPSLDLRIAKPRRDGGWASADDYDRFVDRQRKLHRFYKSLGFRYAGETDGFWTLRS